MFKWIKSLFQKQEVPKSNYNKPLTETESSDLFSEDLTYLNSMNGLGEPKKAAYANPNTYRSEKPRRSSGVQPTSTSKSRSTKNSETYNYATDLHNPLNPISPFNVTNSLNWEDDSYKNSCHSSSSSSYSSSSSFDNSCSSSPSSSSDSSYSSSDSSSSSSSDW
ncbi:hypothetical protein ABE137_06925 [Brevibacillus laterosporus]|uniref:hypothetical protein n=1 Tax=Brevibacillus laterosporus TaxID=1465 RepID=UPI003D194126